MKLINRAIKLLFSQMVIVGLLLLAQILLIVIAVLRLSDYFLYIYSGLVVLSVFAVLHLVDKQASPAVKLAWAIPILLFPVLGGLFYLLVYGQQHRRSISRRMEGIRAATQKHLPEPGGESDALLRARPECGRMVKYMENCAGYQVFQGTQTDYYTIGEQMRDAIFEAIERAEKYIFLEFFIIKNGEFWRELLELLARKAQSGVDVRLLYDGLGCTPHLAMRYPLKLRKMGIKARVFNPFTPFLSMIQNNRDHRKIVVIDGHTAFCGGINIADEYVNITSPYGHWKDTGVRLTGDAAFAYAIMFLRTWSLYDKEPEDYGALCPAQTPGIQSEGFVLPYADSPVDDEKVGEYMYLSAINESRDYLHIMSPYLILEQSMVDAMINAAKSGVDVKIIVPGKSDHWYAHAVARAFYRELTGGGVQIYEYTPGFVHAKSFVWDGHSAIVGTINLDYRSLYMHFECAAWLHGCAAVADIEADFQKTLGKCRRITLEECIERNLIKRLLYSVLRIFAPMM